MSKKRIVVSILVVLIGIILNVLVWNYQLSVSGYTVTIKVQLKSDQKNEFQLFYLNGKQTLDQGFYEEQSKTVIYENTDQVQELAFEVPVSSNCFRMDFGSAASVTEILQIETQYKDETMVIGQERLLRVEHQQMIKSMEAKEQGAIIISQADDPFLVWDVSDWQLEEVVRHARTVYDIVLKVLVCLILDFILLFALKYARKIAYLPIELYENRKLIFSLAKNDFKTKYAGSYLGIFWAFVQPIVTVLVYWFVFEKGLRAGGINTKAGITAPFVLWLIAGLVPWFFFQDALSGGTNALQEYSYLVKKVVFKISILPIVKVVSALFVHIFFVGFMLLLYCGYRYYPNLYTLQIIYYSLAMFIFVLAVTYATCAMVVFFKDLSQIINIVLQVGVWMTPIMWNIDTMELPPVLLTVFKLNPMYYIVTGYRDALINKVWFWENMELTVYFWLLTIIFFGLGTIIFKRLKVHFADVL